MSDNMRIEELADNIWRVRMARDGRWPESGMNRYGVIADMPVRAERQSLDFGKVSPSCEQVGKGFRLRFPLADGERVFGLGDASRDNIQRRPGRYRLRVENITSYIPIPMAWTSRGWGVFVNTTFAPTFDIGIEDPDAMTVTAEEGEVDFYVFTGESPRELLDAYTSLTGHPTLLPIWGYGFTFVCNQNIDQFSLVDETMAFRDHHIPCDTLGLEPGWMEKFYDFTTRKRWDSRKFFFPYWLPAGPHTFVSAMGRVGMKLSLWLCCRYDLFKYEEDLLAGREGPMTRSPDRKPCGYGEIPGEEGWHDDRIEGVPPAHDEEVHPQPPLTPNAWAGETGPYHYKEGERPWFEHLRQFVDQGAAAFKLDGACQVSDWNGVFGRKWSNGMKDEEAHNLYPLVYDKQMARGFSEYTGRRAMVYSAGGWAGLQQFVATWAGDTGGGVKPLKSVLNLGLSGHPNQSFDMAARRRDGTFAGIHFGFLAPWSQLNSWDYWDLPWVDEECAVNTFRAYAEMRYRLAPYIYSTAAEASRTGYPIARPLSLVYPETAEYDDCVDTYMLGDSLLVGVFGEEVTIPPGDWYEWRTGAKVTGPCRLPVRLADDWGGALYVRAGAIVPMWPLRQHLDKGWNETVELHVWPGADGEFTLYEDDGVSLKYRDGEYATTKITHRDGKVEIGERTGSYDGMPAKRDFVIVDAL
jgi:alpha-glucosidase (family GH31 glycosyl hydrolase)